MEDYIVIDRWAKQSLPAIAAHATEAGLFAGSINLNSKNERYYPFARSGEATPIAFQEPDKMHAFVRLLCKVFKDGRDLPFSPTLRASEAIVGSQPLVLSTREINVPPDTFNADQLALAIAGNVQTLSTRVIFIVNATPFIDTTPREALNSLNAVAEKYNLLLIVGFNVAEATEETAAYLTQHCHNLCQLTASEEISLETDSGEPKTVQYFSLLYGNPQPQRIIYSLNDSGEIVIPATPVTDLVRMKECGELFAQQPILQSKFIDRTVGFFRFELKPETVLSMISQAVKHGVLLRSGSGQKHTTITRAGSNNQRKPYRGNRALTSRLDQYSESTNFSRGFETLCNMGDFRILAAEDASSVNATKSLVLKLIKAIVSGDRTLDFKAVTAHRNMVILLVGDEIGAENIRQKVGEPKNATFEVIATNGAISDADFVSLFRATLNAKQPDFFIVLNFDRIEFGAYSFSQLCREIATASSRGVTTIAQTGCWNPDEQLPSEDALWLVRPFVSQVLREDYLDITGEHFPYVYEFIANAGQKQFRTRFMPTTSGAELVPAALMKKLYLRSLFFWCEQTPARELFGMSDVTGKVLNEKTVKRLLTEAANLDIVRLTPPTRKGIKDSLVTFRK